MHQCSPYTSAMISIDRKRRHSTVKRENPTREISIPFTENPRWERKSSQMGDRQREAFLDERRFAGEEIKSDDPLEVLRADTEENEQAAVAAEETSRAEELSLAEIVIAEVDVMVEIEAETKKEAAVQPYRKPLFLRIPPASAVLPQPLSSVPSFSDYPPSRPAFNDFIFF